MPYAKINDINMYYEIHGDGKPLILIEGLGTTFWIWFKQLPVLKNYFKVIVFDNRGVGKTDKPDIEYSIKMFAEDLIGLMDYLNIEKASLFGISMGGFIAQEVAILYPNRVEKLILCSTNFGGPNIVPMDSEVLKFMLGGGSSDRDEKGITKGVEFSFYKDYIQNNIEEIMQILKWKEEAPQPKYAYLRQVYAGANFNEEERISSINVPTLIIAGREDRVVPYQNAVLLHNKIKNSILKIYDGAAHLVNIEKADEVNREIIEFLNK